MYELCYTIAAPNSDIQFWAGTHTGHVLRCLLCEILSYTTDSSVLHMHTSVIVPDPDEHLNGCMQDDSEGTRAEGKRAASYEQQDMSVRHTAPAAAAQTASAAIASRQANTLAATAGPADKAAYSNGAMQGKRSALAFAGACGGTALPTRAEEVVGPERMRTPCHPHADVPTVGSSSTWVTLPPRTQAAPQHPGAGATVKERLAYIGKQLDAFGRRGVILKQFETLGGDDRCIGGVLLQCVQWPLFRLFLQICCRDS